MTATIADRIEEIRKREQAATAGPWKQSGDSIVTDEYCIANIETDGGYEVFGDERNANHQFIAAARTDVPMLLAALEHEMETSNTIARVAWVSKESRDLYIEMRRGELSAILGGAK